MQSPIHQQLRQHSHNITRLSHFWIPTGGIQPPASAREDGHALLQRAGFVQAAGAGLFHHLPLGARVQAKLEALADRHMRPLGASKLALSSLSAEALWARSGRLGAVAELFRLRDRKDSKLLLAPTHEEEATLLAAAHVRSYKDLPLRLYQVSRKYRDELRPRHGLLRAREFVMKDLYTFDASRAAALTTYEAVCAAYARFFRALQLDVAVAHADSGAMGGDLSHEYHLASPAGEDDVLTCARCASAINAERLPDFDVARDPAPACPSCGGTMESTKAIELAHTFFLGTKYSAPLRALVTLPIARPDGTAEPSGAPPAVEQAPTPLQMGCYGIGLSRILAAVAELGASARGLRWPRAIAPFDVVLVYDAANATHAAAAARLAARLADDALPPQQDGDDDDDGAAGLDVALDDRAKGLAWKLHDADLIGCPVTVVLGRGMERGLCEVQARGAGGGRRECALEETPVVVRDVLGRGEAGEGWDWREG